MEHTRKLRRWGGFLLLLGLLVAFLIWNLLAGSVRLPRLKYGRFSTAAATSRSAASC